MDRRRMFEIHLKRHVFSVRNVFWVTISYIREAAKKVFLVARRLRGAVMAGPLRNFFLTSKKNVATKLEGGGGKAP